MYEQGALDAAWDLCKGWTSEEREQLRLDAARHGLRAEIAGRSLREIAGACLDIADRGLRARARAGADGLIPDETHFLNALKDIVDRGESPSDELLRRCETAWGGDVTGVFREYSY